MKNKTPAQRQKLETAARAVAATQTKRRATHRKGVLVVESDPNIQWQLARMLTEQGNRVVGTSSGDGALALISKWPVDLVLVDEDLPGMDGFEVSRKIHQTHPDIPVVLMSDQQDADVKVAARLAGAMTLLTKPFRSETLTAILKSLHLPHLSTDDEDDFLAPAAELIPAE